MQRFLKLIRKAHKMKPIPPANARDVVSSMCHYNQDYKIITRKK